MLFLTLNFLNVRNILVGYNFLGIGITKLRFRKRKLKLLTKPDEALN